MSKLDYIGVRPCGCITAWMSGDSTKAEVRAFYRSMADTGREVRRAALDDIRGTPEFLAECLHSAAASDEPTPAGAAGLRAKEQHRDG